MATLEIAQTLIGLSKADIKWEDDEDEDDDDEDTGTNEGKDSQCEQVTSNSSLPQHDDGIFPDNPTSSSKKITRKGSRRTRRTLNALNNFYLKADELQAFKRQHGHCNVPQTYPENQPLANWVARMRREKKKLDENKQSILDHRKAAYLECFGFEWGQRRGDELWNKRYLQLKEFYEENHHTRVPTKSKVLGRWVSTQRDEFRKLKMGLPSAMTHKKIELLNSLNFCWDCHMQMDESGERKEA